ncbi:hypothetical protein [Roseibium sp.]|uniref:hypothetical protein n=1 Tax=Roseibium sp. TaxID=1936156 RepID=UPI003A979613
MKFPSVYCATKVFAVFTIGFAVMVGLNSRAATNLVERFHEDAQELVDLTSAAARSISAVELPMLGIEVYASHLYMPSRMFQVIADRIDEAHRAM